jgi:hypothetical protein
MMRVNLRLMLMGVVAIAMATTAKAESFFFSTGSPDGLIGTLSRPASNGTIETETADDFILTQPTRIDSATFTGLLPLGASVSNVTRVEIELYHVFPKDSDVGRTSGSPDFSTNQVPTRVNSPADVEITSFTRDSQAGTLSFTPGILNPSFPVANTVVNGIHSKPNQFTGGEGPATGEEVSINVAFNQPLVLPPDHYFFRPEVQLTNGNFLWLSAPKPITGGTGPFNPDLQTWIRDHHEGDGLAPDWLRIGTDITHQGPFNAAFSLSGTVVPEPSSLVMGSTAALIGMGYAWRRRRQATA